MNPFNPDSYPLLHSIAQEWDDQNGHRYNWILGENPLADVHELYLRFVDEKGQRDRFWPRLQAKEEQREEAFSEIEVAYFLDQVNYLPIVDWEPCGPSGRKGEFKVRTEIGELFVEVKSPGWEQDIVKEEQAKDPPASKAWVERKEKRISQGKHSEPRSYDPIPPIRGAVAKASQQMSGDKPNLLIIVDDYFVNFTTSWMQVSWALYTDRQSVLGVPPQEGPFEGQKYNQVGGVGVLRCELEEGLIGGQPKYRYATFENPNALYSLTPFRTQFSKYRWFDKKLEDEPD